MALFRKFYAINVLEKLGSGTYGDVFLGTRRADSLKVAVKKIMRKSVDAKVMEFIVGEVQILKELNHPHIVKIYDLYKDYEAYYICLELVTGGELFSRITKKTFYSELEARNTCKVILSALRHCHNRHIVHRDLKPENLLMQSETDDTSIKIIDFGFAAYAPEPTLKGICGTAIYMAPEIWKGECYGKPVDMWAFGVITYILLGGYPPFSDETKLQLTTQICAGKFRFHEEYWTDVSAQAKDFITQLLTVNVAKRMTVADALRHPWLALSPEELAEHNLSSGLKELKKFNSRRKIRAVIKTVVAIKRFEKILQTSRSTPPSSPHSSVTESFAEAEVPTVESGPAVVSEAASHHGKHEGKTVKFDDDVVEGGHKPPKRTAMKVDESEFDRLVKTYSTCYESDDDIPDPVAPVVSPGLRLRGQSMYAGAHGKSDGVGDSNLPPPPAEPVQRGLTGALSMYQGNNIKISEQSAASQTKATAKHGPESGNAVVEAIRKLESTNADLEAVVQQLMQTISGHQATIASNKAVIASLKSLSV